ncbi:unnamed protein product [Miscanthus lutarioriparius]|uniref:Uncharacterized protein n=1 Tax=Miscanthus lutarioriparius TaxID=422564 RepID=A0A811SEC3_9POAL|nr:unnamed protein product [Miscanthus lutarioriparius]
MPVLVKILIAVSPPFPSPTGRQHCTRRRTNHRTVTSLANSLHQAQHSYCCSQTRHHSCHALRRAVHDKLCAVELQLRACYHSLAGASSSTTSSAVAALGALLYDATAFPRAAAFFLPLVATTSLCCVVACLFTAAERGTTKEAAVEVVLVGGEGKAEARLLQVKDDANGSELLPDLRLLTRFELRTTTPPVIRAEVPALLARARPALSCSLCGAAVPALVLLSSPWCCRAHRARRARLARAAGRRGRRARDARLAAALYRPPGNKQKMCTEQIAK